MNGYRDTMRTLILKRWMQEQERSLAWVARHSGYSREYLSYVINDHMPFTDRLAQRLTERIGIVFEYREDTENAPSPAHGPGNQGTG